LKDEWENLPNLPLKALSANLIVVKNRFIVAFGLSTTITIAVKQN